MTRPAKVLVLGASRGVGLETVKALARRGVAVRAFARRRTPVALPNVAAVEGDALKARDVAAALEGCDAVALTLGLATRHPVEILRGHGRTPIDICSRGAAVLVRAMREAGVSRLVALSADGVGGSGADRSLVARLFVATALGRVMQDKAEMEAIVRGSDLDHTIVRPVGLTEGAATGRVLVSPQGRSEAAIVTRADVAEVIADALLDGLYRGEAVTVSETRRGGAGS